MMNFVGALYAYHRICANIDAGKSVLFSAPRYCNEWALIETFRRDQSRYADRNVAVAKLKLHPTTRGVDFSGLWLEICDQLKIRKRLVVDNVEQFKAELSNYLRRTPKRTILVLSGAVPGENEQYFDLLTLLHSLQLYGKDHFAEPFQFVASDEFLILFDDLYRRDIARSELYLLEHVSLSQLDSREIARCLHAIPEASPIGDRLESLSTELFQLTGGHPGLVFEALNRLAQMSWQIDDACWSKEVTQSLIEGRVLEGLRSALEEDPSGLAVTALGFEKPDYAIEYNNPRLAQLRRLGILYRNSLSTLALFGGPIGDLVRNMSRARREKRLGMVQREIGKVDFSDKKFVPNDEDIIVIHLSDLHVGAGHGFRLGFSGRTINPDAHSLVDLIDQDIRDLEFANRVDAIVISGDFVCEGLHDEFARAREVIDHLLEVTKVPRSRLLIAAGNHDLKWLPKEFASTWPGGSGVSREAYEAFRELLGMNPKHVADLVEVPSRSGERKLRIVGLDSNYVEGREAAGIGYIAKETLDAAGKLLDLDPIESYGEVLTWFVVHHHLLPICDSSTDEARVRNVSVMGNSSEILDRAHRWRIEAVLHGHQHQPAIAVARRWIGETGEAQFRPIMVIGAGSCGAKRDCLGPVSRNQYYIHIRRKNELLVRSRWMGDEGLHFTCHSDLAINLVR